MSELLNEIVSEHRCNADDLLTLLELDSCTQPKGIVYEKIVDRELLKMAVRNAADGHNRKREVKAMMADIDGYVDRLAYLIESGDYLQELKYRPLTKTNANGKVRHIMTPSLLTRVLQHYFIVLALPIYQMHDNLNGLNCKEGAGITSVIREKSVIKKMKHMMYDRRDLTYGIIIDQRKCYEHIKPKVFRHQAKYFIKNRWIIDFGIDVGFVDGKLPVGTPTSPLIHHFVMLRFDQWIKQAAPFSLRYADDVFVAARTKEEAVSLSWRIQNYWWYELCIRAKIKGIRIQPLDKPVSLCGYVLHRNEGPRDKGYTTVRQNIVKRARRCRTDESWGSYFGIFSHADEFGLMLKIEGKMKLRALTDKIKLDRHLDAPNIAPRDLEGVEFTIYDYELRYDKDKNPNWIKCLIGIEELDANGQPNGKVMAREFHGGYQYLVDFICECQKRYGKSFLPLEEVKISNQCGYIFENSTNQLQYIEE